MKLRASLLISFRYLFARGPGKPMSLKRIRGGIIGIALSLIPLVVVFQVANGMIGGISVRYIETSSYHIKIEPTNSNNRTIKPGYVAAVARVPGVTWAAPELQGMAIAASKERSKGVQIRAVVPELFDEAGFRANLRVIAGTLDISNPQSIVIGQEIAHTLRLSVGDPVRLVTSSSLSGAMLPRISNFRVAGIVSCGYQQLDGMWVFVNLDRGRRILPASTGEEFIGVKVEHPYRLPNPLYSEKAQTPADNPLEAISQSLGQGWRSYTWFEDLRGEFLNFVTTRNLLLLIMVLIVLIASVNVSSSMIMLVMEKQAEIAILKSIGAGPGSLALVFIVAGGVTGAIGALIGLCLGAVAAWRVNELVLALEWVINGVSSVFWHIGQGLGGAPFQPVTILNPAFYLDRLPIDIRFGDLLLMGLLTVALSMVASFFPARRAARLKPLQILRKV